MLNDANQEAVRRMPSLVEELMILRARCTVDGQERPTPEINARAAEICDEVARLCEEAAAEWRWNANGFREGS